MEDKVYCNDCRYYAASLVGDACLHESNKHYVDYYNEKELEVIELPKIKNKNNNCRDFEKKPIWPYFLIPVFLILVIVGFRLLGGVA